MLMSKRCVTLTHKSHTSYLFNCCFDNNQVVIWGGGGGNCTKLTSLKERASISLAMTHIFLRFSRFFISCPNVFLWCLLSSKSLFFFFNSAKCWCAVSIALFYLYCNCFFFAVFYQFDIFLAYR